MQDIEGDPHLINVLGMTRICCVLYSGPHNPKKQKFLVLVKL